MFALVSLMAVVDLQEEVRHARPTWEYDYCQRAYSRIARGHYTLATADANEAVRCDSYCATAYYARGMARAATADLEGAISDFDDAIRFCDESDANLHFARGVCRFELGQFDAAIADFDEVLRTDRDVGGAYFYRAYCWGGKRRDDLALPDLEEAIDCCPDFEMALYAREACRNRLILEAKLTAEVYERIAAVGKDPKPVDKRPVLDSHQVRDEAKLHAEIFQSLSVGNGLREAAMRLAMKELPPPQPEK